MTLATRLDTLMSKIRTMVTCQRITSGLSVTNVSQGNRTLPWSNMNCLNRIIRGCLCLFKGSLGSGETTLSRERIEPPALWKAPRRRGLFFSETLPIVLPNANQRIIPIRLHLSTYAIHYLTFSRKVHGKVELVPCNKPYQTIHYVITGCWGPRQSA